MPTNDRQSFEIFVLKDTIFFLHIHNNYQQIAGATASQDHILRSELSKKKTLN